MFSCDNIKHKEVLPADTFTIVCFHLTNFLIFFYIFWIAQWNDVHDIFADVVSGVCVFNAHN